MRLFLPASAHCSGNIDEVALIRVLDVAEQRRHLENPLGCAFLCLVTLVAVKTTITLQAYLHCSRVNNSFFFAHVRAALIIWPVAFSPLWIVIREFCAPTIFISYSRKNCRHRESSPFGPLTDYATRVFLWHHATVLIRFHWSPQNYVSKAVYETALDCNETNYHDYSAAFWIIYCYWVSKRRLFLLLNSLFSFILFLFKLPLWIRLSHIVAQVFLFEEKITIIQAFCFVLSYINLFIKILFQSCNFIVFCVNVRLINNVLLYQCHLVWRKNVL